MCNSIGFLAKNQTSELTVKSKVGFTLREAYGPSPSAESGEAMPSAEECSERRGPGHPSYGGAAPHIARSHGPPWERRESTANRHFEPQRGRRCVEGSHRMQTLSIRPSVRDRSSLTTLFERQGRQILATEKARRIDLMHPENCDTFSLSIRP